MHLHMLSGFGTMLTVLCSISLLPYLAFLAMGVGRIEPSNLMGHNVTADGFGDLVQVRYTHARAHAHTLTHTHKHAHTHTHTHTV